jgi:hypothetical protein
MAMVKAPQSDRMPVPVSEVLPETRSPASSSLATLAVTGLAFLGNEVLPRLADVLFAALERKVMQPAAASNTQSSKAAASNAQVPKEKNIQTRRGRGVRRQVRFRGGRSANQIQMKRR